MDPKEICDDDKSLVVKAIRADQLDMIKLLAQYGADTYTDKDLKHAEKKKAVDCLEQRASRRTSKEMSELDDGQMNKHAADRCAEIAMHIMARRGSMFRKADPCFCMFSLLQKDQAETFEPPGDRKRMP